MEIQKSNLNALNLFYNEDSVLVKNTKKKMSLLDGLEYLNLSAKSNAVAIEAFVNYAGENLEKHEKIDLTQQKKLTTENKLITKQKQIIAYNRNEIRKLFNFKDNGFMFDSVQPEVLALLKKFNADNELPLFVHLLGQEMKAMLEEWAKKQNLQYDHIIPLGAAYRKEFSETAISTNSSISRFSPLSLTHVDFDQNNTPEFLKAFNIVWKGAVQSPLGKVISDEEYEQMNIVQMVNVWMPLNKQPTENILAVMDASRIQKDDLVPITFTIPGVGTDFTAMTLNPSHKHQFVVQSDMQLGDAVIFNTFDTPHTAVTVARPEAQKGVPRESVEMRVIFISNLPKL